MVQHVELPRIRRPVNAVLNEVEARLAGSGESVGDVIRRKHLYFRVSVVGSCNLNCEFCHNEGGPDSGRLDVATAVGYIRAAEANGFERVQFTGGEPLLHPDIAEFVRAARTIMTDVGVTTNGTHLGRRAASLLDAGISRVHVSLQAETLEQANSSEWAVPDALRTAADALAAEGVTVRFNVPVAEHSVAKAAAFLRRTRESAWRFNLFALLPSRGDAGPHQSYVHELRRVADEASTGWVAGDETRVVVRGYHYPQGVRCSACSDRVRCTEQSRSLRLGVDEVLRPCLATRAWDLPPAHAPFGERVRAATLLSIDW
jgi:molybdenum cofactor biosynthesis enzyme MoaA